MNGSFSPLFFLSDCAGAILGILGILGGLIVLGMWAGKTSNLGKGTWDGCR